MIIYQTVKKRKPKKLTASQHAAAAHLAKLEIKWDKLYGKLATTKRRPAEIPKLMPPAGRETRDLPSLVTSGGSTAKKEAPVYSGTLIKGLGQMHKSNLTVILNKEDAVAISQMRRN
jgi:hypothetical protein